MQPWKCASAVVAAWTSAPSMQFLLVHCFLFSSIFSDKSIYDYCSSKALGTYGFHCGIQSYM
jgi:hypothetical protein